MAFVAWRTWVAGAVGSAAQMNQDVRDNLNAWFPLAASSGLAWASYTPTLTQSGAVAKTTVRGKYTRIGNTVVVHLILQPSSGATANNVITVSLPVTAVSATNQTIGTAKIFDSSAGLSYPAVVLQASTTTASMVDSTAATAVAVGQTGAAFAAALTAGDELTMLMTYEAA